MSAPFLIFDVESIGLHGESFAVAGMLLDDEGPGWTFIYACNPNNANGSDDDREWIKKNIPKLNYNCADPKEVRSMFWDLWLDTKHRYPDVILAAECAWPVEARFLIDCVKDDPKKRNWEGPYPLHDITSVMLAAGMDPMANYNRLKDEEPAHHPLADVRQSARLLQTALKKVNAHVD